MKEKNFEFPTAYTIIDFFILIVVTMLTHIVPAGKYSNFVQSREKIFVVHNQSDEDVELEASQETLNKL